MAEVEELKKVIRKANLKFSLSDIENYYIDIKNVIKKSRLDFALSDIENHYIDIKTSINSNLNTVYEKPYIRKKSKISDDNVFYDDIF